MIKKHHVRNISLLATVTLALLVLAFRSASLPAESNAISNADLAAPLPIPLASTANSSAGAFTDVDLPGRYFRGN
jgi:hypothetical protein